jgi:hypothetical protein
MHQRTGAVRVRPAAVRGGTGGGDSGDGVSFRFRGGSGAAS